MWQVIGQQREQLQDEVTTNETRTQRTLLPPQIVTDLAGMARLEEEWRQLANSSSLCTVFQTWEWNAAWWKHYGGRTRRLRLVVLRSEADGTLVGLAPLYVSWWYGSPLRRLAFIGSGTSDYVDALAAPGWEDKVCDGLYTFLHKRRGWDIADFTQLRIGGLLRSRPPSAASGLDSHDLIQEPCPYLPLPSTWDELRAQFGKKTRSNIGYYDRALQKVYQVDVGVVSSPDALDAALTRLFDLHQRRWNQRWLPGVFGGRRVQAFHREAARALLSQGWLRLYTLKLDGETQASLYCFAFGDRVCYYQGGFEPTLAKWSLGTILTARVLQDAIAETRRVFDFLRGDEPYKAKWTASSQANARRVLAKRGRLQLGRLAKQIQNWEWTIEKRVKATMRNRTQKT